tara:strand:+ start:26 stop:274 length:249 start_codon:yes stop_codon:yes gene_type:complete
MIEHVLTVDDFPKWALSALINNDYSGISADDGIELDKFLEYFKEVTHWDVDSASLEHGNFNRYPAFGLAADCCTVQGYANKG